MAFMNENFMLTNEPAKKLFDASKDMPIFDYHCHLDPKEIYEDKQFTDITSTWLGGDHYKWRLMRANGVSEHYITGDASNKEKFEAWAKTLAKAFGNPLYHWSHLEMFRLFGIEEHMTEDNWEEMYDRMNQIIEEKEFSPLKMIKGSNVAMIGTTDGPLDSLEWHQKIAADERFDGIKVAPSFRPDQAFVEHVDFANFTNKLAEVTEMEVKDFSTFVAAMENRVQYFVDNGCRATDISFSEITFYKNDALNVDDIFNKAIAGEAVTREEELVWQTELFSELCRIYNDYDLINQIHFGARRNNNEKYFPQTGADAGFDSIGDQTELAENLNLLLNDLVMKESLPKTIIYNLNPAYNTVVVNAAQNFQANEEGIQSKVQFGSGWWFADTELGMIDQMLTTAEQGLLANFVGMLTDSRSFLSYQRHEYFRRILADIVGKWVVDGKVPEDYELLNKFVQDISYNNVAKYFEKVEK